jgi:hypothetical protein
MRKSLHDLITELQHTTNPVTYWALKVCVIDRLNRKEFNG